jgi:hypothetical protein
MKPGLDQDDIWIMVEDELQATASLFTRHLHAAEYKRLKHLAKTRNTTASDDLAPASISAAASNETKIKAKAIVQEARQKSILKDLAPSDSSDSEPWTQDTHLAALMARPKQSSRKLATATGASSKTRAVAGFTETQSQSQGLSLSGPRSQEKNAQSSAAVEDLGLDLDDPYSSWDSRRLESRSGGISAEDHSIVSQQDLTTITRDGLEKDMGLPTARRQAGAKSANLAPLTFPIERKETKSTTTASAPAHFKSRFKALDELDDFPEPDPVIKSKFARNTRPRDSTSSRIPAQDAAFSSGLHPSRKLTALQDQIKVESPPSHREQDPSADRKSHKSKVIDLDEIPTFQF